jgi:hypothetical protein
MYLLLAPIALMRHSRGGFAGDVGLRAISPPLSLRRNPRDGESGKTVTSMWRSVTLSKLNTRWCQSR